MAYANFKPEAWSQSLNLALRKSLVASALVNRDYEGDVLFNSKVHIIRPLSLTVRNYTGADLTAEEATSSTLEMTIDYQKYLNFRVKDIDKVQTDVKIAQIYIEQAKYDISLQVDTDIMAYLAANPHTDNIIGEGISLTKSNIIETITNAMQALDLKNVPQQGRVMIISPYEHKLLLDAKVITPMTQAQDSIFASGVIGQAFGFNLLLSNNLYTETTAVGSGHDYSRYCLFGHPDNTTFASQIESIEPYRTQDNFMDGVKALFSYGMKSIKPEALGVIKNKLGHVA